MHRIQLAMIALALAPACAVPSIDVMPRYGTIDVDGVFGVQDTTLGGPSVQADISEAGFSKDSGVAGLRADLDFGVPRVMVSFQTSNHDGSGTLTGTLTDSQGNSIGVGSPVDSKLDLGVYQGIVTWDVLASDANELGFGFGVVGVDVDGSIVHTTPGGDTLDLSEFVPVPVLAARGGVEFGNFEISGVLDGIALGVGDTDLNFLDLDLFARYAFFGGANRVRFSAGLGFRHVDMDLESNEDGERIVLDAAFNGPYFLLHFSI